MFIIDISRPACAKAISLSATKNPCLVRKPLAVGSDKSQIFKTGKKKLVVLTTYVLFFLKNVY